MRKSIMNQCTDTSPKTHINVQILVQKSSWIAYATPATGFAQVS